MKRTINIFGIISVMLVSLGATAKVMHWPGAGWLLTLGMLVLLLLYGPLALMNNFTGMGRKARPFYLVVYLSILLVFGGALFKIMHWPGDEFLMIIAIPFPFVVFIPFLLYYSGKIPSISMNQLIVLLLFMGYFGVSSTFLAMGLSSDVLTEAVIIEKEFSKLNQYLEKSNKMMAKKSVARNSELSKVIKEEIDILKNEIINISAKKDENYARDDMTGYFDLPGKDDYDPVSTILHWSNPRVKELALNLTHPGKFDLRDKLMPFYQMDSREYLVTKIGNNPKIWALANLSFLEYQVNVNTHLQMKNKLLED